MSFIVPRKLLNPRFAFKSAANKHGEQVVIDNFESLVHGDLLG